MLLKDGEKEFSADNKDSREREKEKKCPLNAVLERAEFVSHSGFSIFSLTFSLSSEEYGNENVLLTH